jgi:hypothetical protein
LKYFGLRKELEAAPRFELGMKVLQTSALPLGYAALIIKKNGFPYLKETQNFLKRETRFELATATLAR